MASWNVTYPINFTVDGDQTQQAIYKFIQEFNKIYGHLNELQQKAATPPQIVVSGVVDDVSKLPVTAEVGETWVVNGAYYIWDGLEWIAIGGSSSYDYATENTDGLVRLGTLNGINSGSPSDRKVITEFILKTLLDTYSPPSSGGEDPGSGGMLRGTIVMWYGMPANIPSGWALCDGTNGTPDMRGRFPRGVPASTSSPGTKGGIDSLALTAANMPAHTHSLTMPPHLHTFTGTAHTHAFTNTAHSHTIGNHAHTSAAHVHTVGSHAHSVSLTAASNGDHAHNLAGSTTGARVVAYTSGIGWYKIRINENDLGTYVVSGLSLSNSNSLRAYTDTSSAGAHTHAVSGNTGGSSAFNTGSTTPGNTGSTTPSCSQTSISGTIGNATGSGSIEQTTCTGTIGSAGSGTAFDNRPAYCELIFIMKL
jgi:microcystin-dependent protein